MSNKALIIIVVIAVVAIGGYFLLSTRVSAPPAEENAVNTNEPQNTTVNEEPLLTTVTYTDNGFEPSRATIKQGETVRFVNQSGSPMWVGADEHPTHTSYDGTSRSDHCSASAPTSPDVFDECAGAPTGSSWEFTFDKAGTFGYHNHLRAEHTGTVVVSN